MYRRTAVPDQDVPLKFDQLPPRVQEGFNQMRAKLPAEFILRDLRAMKHGWAMTIYTTDGKYGGEVSVMAEDDELPLLRSKGNGKG
jgi:hypothetical protein